MSLGTKPPERITSISVTFRNDTVFQEQWTIKDGSTDQIVFEGTLGPRGDCPGDCVSVSLSAPDGKYGDAHYKHEGQSIFSHRSLIENGETVHMS